MNTSHICIMDSECDIQGTETYTCGACGKIFNTICTLHQHVTLHSTGGAYHYDNVTKVAFPKLDSTCSSAQTDDMLTNFLQQLEFTRKFGQMSGIEFGEEREGTADPNKDVTNDNKSKCFQKDSDKVFSAEQEQGKPLLGKTSNRASGQEKIDAVSMALDEKSGVTNKKNTASVIEATQGLSTVRNYTATPCSVRLDRLKDKNELGISEKSEESFFPDSHMANFPKKRRICSNSDRKDKFYADKSQAMSVNLDDDDDDDDDYDDDFSQSRAHLSTSESREIHNEKEGVKEYFYGKISVDVYEIERTVPDGMFYRGERNGENRVVSENTWMPDSVLESEKSGSYDTSTNDKADMTKVAEYCRQDKDDNKFSKECFKELKRNPDCEQRPLFVCNVCSKSFKLKENLNSHMNIHLELTPFMCQYCGMQFHSVKALNSHQYRVHSDRNKWVTCQICGDKKFPTAARLREHVESHRTEYKFVCPKCKKVYKSTKLLNDHFRYAHNEKEFRCHLCKQGFNSQAEMDTHKRENHNKINKCKYCDKVFTSSRSKIRHEKIHLGVKPHECHICFRRFLQKGPYWVHMEKHHDLTKPILIQLFPDKHVDKNRQHLVQESQPALHNEETQ